MPIGDDWSWLAGIFEGEGTAGMYPSSDKRLGRVNRDRLVVVVSQKERALLEEVKRIAGCGSIHFQKSWNGWMWVAASRAGRMVLTKMFPYLRSPRRQIQVAETLTTDERLRREADIALREHRRTIGKFRDPVTGRFHAKVS